MRTLKKVLALTIALATLFSLTAFAAYKDESAIASETMSAVNLVNSLKIMTGDTKGNFNPTATITRAEAAKMVYVVRTGGNTNADGWKGQNVFADTKGHWAEGFINYCASVGIIAGVGNNKFNPEGKLTGVELAKMLLVAAGYKADIQGYTGSAWLSKVLADAENAGLFNKYAPAYVGAAPRQYAAVMFSNCLLKTNMAVYLSGELVTGTVGTPVLVGAKYFGLASKSGVPTAMTATALTVDGKEFTNVTVNTDLRYQDVTVVYNGNTNEVYDLYASGKSKVYNVGQDDITIDGNTLAFTGYAETEYAADAKFALYETSAITTKVTAADLTGLAGLAAQLTATNEAMRLIDQNGDGKIDVAIRTDAKYSTVVSNKATDGTFDLNDTIAGFETAADKTAYNKLVFADTVDKGDVVKLTYNMAGQKVIAKVTPVVGIATLKDGVKYVVGGTKFSAAANKVGSYTFELTLGKEYNVYTDGVYAVYAAEVTDTAPTEFSSNIALVLATNYDDYAASTDLNPVTPRVQVLLSTGETKIFEWGGTKTELNAVNTAIASAKVVMQYTLKDGKMTLKNVVDPDGASAAFVANESKNLTFTKSTGVFTYDTAAAKVTADTYFFMQKNGDATKFVVVKASELKDNVSSIAVSGAAYTVKNGVKTLAFAYIPAQAPAATAVNTYAIVNGTVADKWDAAEEAIVKVIAAVDMKGNKIEIALEEATGADAGKVFVDGTATDTVAKTVYKVVTDADGFSRLITAVDVATKFEKGATVAGFDSTSILVGSSFVDFASDMTTIFVKTSTMGVLTGKTLATADTVDYVLNTDGDISTLIVYKAS